MMWMLFTTITLSSLLAILTFAVKSTFARSRRRRTRKKLASCITFTVLVFFLSITLITLWCWSGCEHPPSSPGPYITYFPHRSWRDTSPKLLLLWTTNYGDPYWALPQDGSYKFEGCPVSTCRITIDKSDFSQSDAVLFHSRTLWNFYMGHAVPSHHPDHQAWVYFDLEPPTRTYLNMKDYNNFFNWTWTYRTDSEVVNPYGRMVRHDDENISWENEKDPVLKAAGQSFRDASQEVSEPQRITRNYRKEKTRLAAWTASNCPTHSRRYRIVKRLRKYLDIDLFGACGDKTLKCSNRYKESREECEDELAQYRFYLAFENSLCKDYHTEKLWFALKRAQIPVVYGGCDYSKVIPRNSYIDIRDFSSLEELAAYIRKVDSDEDLYNSYMWWHQYYKVQVYPGTFCELCAALHDKSKPAQVYSDLDGWFRDDTCPLFSIFEGVAMVIEGWLLHYGLSE